MAGKDFRPSKRYPASKKERRRVASLLSNFISGVEPESVEHVEFRDGTILYIVNSLPCIIVVGEKPLPHLKCLLQYKDRVLLPKVVVDRGATAAVGRGADLMVPGIRRLDGTFNSGEVVIIVDEQASVPIAVGEAIMSSEEILEKLAGERRGRAIRVLHRPGDRFWKMAEAL
jgi:predicted RNA-binding protein (TIGR00451 family)